MLEGHTEADAESANVVAEIRGRERPDEIVVLGGHIDSWDVGAGASDDGVGCIVTWEALRLMKKLGIQPRRTVRLRALDQRGEWHRRRRRLCGAIRGDRRRTTCSRSRRIPASSSRRDSGSPAASPRGTCSATSRRSLAPLNLADMISGGGGADIDPIAQAGRVPTVAYMGDPGGISPSTTPRPTPWSGFAPEEVSKAAAAISVMTYVIADMPERLPAHRACPRAVLSGPVPARTVVAKVPVMSLGVLHHVAPCPVRLVRERAHDLRTRGRRACEVVVGIRNEYGEKPDSRRGGLAR